MKNARGVVGTIVLTTTCTLSMTCQVGGPPAHKVIAAAISGVSLAFLTALSVRQALQGQNSHDRGSFSNFYGLILSALVFSLFFLGIALLTD